MADATASSPSPQQAAWKRQLEIDRMRAEQKKTDDEWKRTRAQKERELEVNRPLPETENADEEKNGAPVLSKEPEGAPSATPSAQTESSPTSNGGQLDQKQIRAGQREKDKQAKKPLDQRQIRAGQREKDKQAKKPLDQRQIRAGQREADALAKKPLDLGQIRGGQKNGGASQGAEGEGGGDGGSPRLAAAAGKAANTARMAAKVAGTVGGAQGKAVGKTLKQGAEVLDQAQIALQEMSVEAISREVLYWVKTWILWPAVGINIVLEPLSAFSITFVAMQLYWIMGMFGSKYVKPMPIWEHVIMINLTFAQIVFFLVALTTLLVTYCILSPACQWDIFKNAIIPNVL